MLNKIFDCDSVYNVQYNDKALCKIEIVSPFFD